MSPNTQSETFTRKPVENLLRARSVAIVGASTKGRWPSGIYRNLKTARFPGQIYLINPNYTEIFDDKCYPNLAALPKVPEHLLMLIPTRAVLGTIEEAAKLGTKAATIYSAGFGEGEDAKGKERAQAMKEICARTGFVVCGPNCMGSFSLPDGLWSFPTPVPLLKRGPVGLIFQSGGSLGNWVKGASERGIGFTYAVSSGNEVNLDLVDYLSFLVDDPDTKLITLMVEGVRRPREFMAVAEQALKRNKPILVVKLGRSAMGKRQAISHTGALAGADEVFDAMCHRLGLIRVPTLEDLTEMTLAFMPGRYPRGSRAAIVVNSGGMKGLLCDHCDELSTNLAQLSDTTKAAVRPLIPEELVVENPLECGVAGFGDEQGFVNIVKLHAEDDGVDLLAIHGELPRGEKREAALFRNLAAATDKPILAFARSTYSCTDESRAYQDEAGIPFLQAIKPTLRALAGLGSYGERLQTGIPSMPPASGKLADLEGDRFNSLLQSHGLSLPRQKLVESASEAAQAARGLGFPVALKLIAPEIIHKTESGAVALGLNSADDVEAQGKRLLALAKGSAKLLVQEMVKGTEILLGARTDPQYGPFLIVGLGGIFVEVLKDIAVRLLPVSEAEAWAMLKELKGYKILEGVRGQPPRDTAALVKAMAGLSDIFLTYRNHLTDLEFNPIMLRAQGQGLAAVDVRMIRK
ncbi:MAG TPA: acetate--CoA ligase family protein [Candidatus Binatia bacterium]|nr:acetate--CoA ligase family protein [Candidatus Binatia bacterium]